MSESEKSIPRQYELSSAPKDIKDLQSGLARTSARGAVLLQNIMTDEHVHALRNDIVVASADTQTDDQWSISFRLNEGDQRDVKRLHTIHGLADSLTKLLATDLPRMNTAFKRLENWSPTEFTAVHHTLVPETPVARKWHESKTPMRNFETNPPRFWGVIAVAIAEGSADFHTNGDNSMTWEVQPGDIMVMRGAHLFDEKDANSSYPSFAVDNVSATDGLTTVIYRANAEPNHIDPDFTYKNWPTESDITEE